MRPDEFRGILKDVHNILTGTDLYLSGKTSNGKLAIRTVSELDHYIDVCNQYKGTLSACIRGLQKDSPKLMDYKSCLDKLCECEVKLKIVRDEIITQSHAW